MSSQLNVRFPKDLLTKARVHADENGYGTVQDFIRETVREKIYEEEPELSEEEYRYVKKIYEAAKKNGFLGEEELERAFKEKIHD